MDYRTQTGLPRPTAARAFPVWFECVAVGVLVFAVVALVLWLAR